MIKGLFLNLITPIHPKNHIPMPASLTRFIVILLMVIVLCSSQYCNQSANGTVTCYPCHYKCKDCSGLTQFDCLSCTQEYLLVNNTCQSCGDNCYSCKTILNTTDLNQSIIEQQCETCIEGYYLYQSTGTCIQCPTGAQTCTLSAIQSCSSQYYLLNGVCSSCQSNCNSCSDSVTCNTCSDGYLLNSSGNCVPCPISNCLSCSNSLTCDLCAQGYSGNTCNQTCPDKCSMCYSGICFVCIDGFYMLNGSCEAGMLLCSIGSSYSQCIECVSDLSSLNSNSICIPFYIVHQQNRLLYFTGINNFNSFSSLFLPSNTTVNDSKFHLYCSYISTYIVASLTDSISLSTVIDPSYQVALKAQLFVSSLMINVEVYVNGMATNSSLVEIVQGELLYQCENSSFYIINLNTTFPLSSSFNASQSNLTITLKVSSAAVSNLTIGSSEMYLELYRCRVSNCLSCISPYTCQICLFPYQLENNECVISCSEGYYLTETDAKTTCTLSCNNGFYPIWQDYLCSQCVYPCVQCSDQYTCSKCYHPNTTIINSTINSTYFLYNSSCVSSCPNLYFADTQTYQCQECIFPCQQCIGFYQCTSCKMGYLNTDNYTCVAQCPSGQYSDFLQLKCLPCQSPCSTCQYSALACLQCVQPYYLLAKNSSCLSDCPTGYAMIVDSIWQCKECDFPCKSCENSTTNCTTCMKGYLYQNQCQSDCPAGYYKSTTSDLNNICVKCQNNCDQCLEQEICISCLPGFNFNTIDKTCVSECPKSTFQSMIIQNNTSNSSTNSSLYECLQCIPPCYDCTNATYCLSCTGLLFLNHLGGCLLECPLGTFIYYNSTLQERQCMFCDVNCIDCVSDSNCNECKAGWYLYEGLCYDACPLGTYTNQKGYNYCELCEYPCEQCVNDYQCVSCVSGFMLQVDEMKCIQYCVDGYYESLSSINPITNTSYNTSNSSQLMQLCLQCSVQCQQCVTVATNCLSCSLGYYYNNQTQLCSKQCPSGTYYSQTSRACSLCQWPCKTCSSYLTCLSCYSSNQYVNQSSSNSSQSILYLHHCVQSCPTGYFQLIDSQSNQTTCSICTYPCEQCSNTSKNCTKCSPSSLTFYNLTVNNTTQNFLSCLSQCPSGYYQQNYQCQSCKQPCVQCYSESYCLSCIDGWYLLEGQCYESYCPFHYFMTIVNGSGLCMKCDQSCRECITTAANCSSCVNNYFLISAQIINSSSSSSSFTCIKQCPAQYYAQSSTMQCILCEVPCLQCYSKGYCITCASGYLMEIDKCVAACDDTFYLDSPNSTYCSKCVAPCQSCIDSVNCSSCVAGYFYLSDNYSCVTACPSKMYGYKIQVYTSNSSNSFKGTCMQCSQLCQQCASFSTCLSCNSSSDMRYLQSGRCQSNCSEGFYLNYDVSLFYAYQCYACGTNCVSCLSLDKCLKCVSSYLYEYKCISACPTFYYGSSSLQCEKCTSPCYQCLNEYNCINCVSGYYLYNDICVKHCPQNLWSDEELRECVSECGAGKFRNYENKSCVLECDRFYSSEGDCVDDCVGLNNVSSDGMYLINSSKGCEWCDNLQYCKSVYQKLSYSLQYVAVNGRLLVIVKYQTAMEINSKYIQLSNNNSDLRSYLSFNLSVQDIANQELAMYFLTSQSSSTPTSSSTSTSSSFNSALNVSSFLTQSFKNVRLIQQIAPANSPFESNQTSHNLFNLTYISATTSTNSTNNNINTLQPTSLTQYLFYPNILWLELSTLPSQSQSLSGYLTYQLQNYLQLLSSNTYNLSTSSSTYQQLPLQQISSQNLQITSFSPYRKLPQWVNSLMKTIANIFSYAVLILIVINVIVDNTKSVFHLIDTAQNCYLLLWVSNQLQLGISPYLQGFSISALLFSFSPTYGFDGYQQSIKTIPLQILQNCTPKQLIYTNTCQFTQYYYTILPFIGLFILIIAIAKLIIYLKPTIQTTYKIHHKIIYNHLNNFYWLFITPIFFISTSQLILLKQISNIAILNLILIIFVPLLTLILAYQILKNIFNSSFEEKTFFWGLKCHKISNQQANIHFLLLMIRKSIMLVAAALGTASSNKEIVFVFLLVFVSIIILSNILANSPFKKKLYQYLLVACEVLLIAFYLLIEIYIVSIKNFDGTVYIVYNIAMFLISVLVIVLHFIITFIETFKNLKRKYHQYQQVEESKVDESKSSSCDTSQHMSKKKDFKISQKTIKSDNSEENNLVLSPTLQKLKGSDERLKITQPQPKSISKTESEQNETKNEKLNNSQDSHYESSSGFQFHSVQNSEQFQEPAKYLIKLQKNIDSSEESSKN